MKTIKYDFTDLRQEFLSILKDFQVGMQTEKIRQALGKNLSKQIIDRERIISNRLQGDFSLVVVGDFKRGKSTLINALLGEEIVTTNVTPETVTINEIQYGETPKIEAILTDGGRVSLESEELHSNKLIPLLKKLPEIANLRIETRVEWLQGLRIVDTPGTGDIFDRFDRQVQTYLTKADAVLFVISALSPLSESERTFLQFSVLPQDFPKVFFIVNMMDIARTDEEAKKLSNSIETKINRLFPNTRIFGVSARDEFCRLKSLPRPNSERAAKLAEDFKTFRESIEESILLNRDLIQLNRAANQMSGAIASFESQILLLRNGITSNQVELGKAIAQCQDDSSELFTKIKQHKQQMRDEINGLFEQACEWINEFMDRTEREAIASIPNYKLTEVRRHYHFFLTDSFRKAIDRCLDTHRSVIIESADKAAQNIAQDFQSLTQSKIASEEIAQGTFTQAQWTNFDTLQLVMSYTGLGAIAALLIDRARESGESSKIQDYQQKLKTVFPQLRVSIIEQLRSVYRNIAQKIEQTLQNTYQQEIETSLSALQQAQELSSQGEEKRAAINEGLKEALSVLADTRQSVQNLQQKLWSDC